MASGVLSTARRLLSQLIGQHFGGDRDLYTVCGYPRRIGVHEYVKSYCRQDIASRIIDAFPDATWRESPKVTAKNEDEDGTFAAAVEKLDEQFGFWDTLARLDRLMAMGHYGTLLIGVDGGEPMDRPVQGSGYNLLYLSPHGEYSSDIVEWDMNPASPRFGKPERYRITIGVGWTGFGGGERSLNVHWSRVIHVAEKPLDDISIGTPRLERIWNRLMDLDKLLGGGAETYWQNAVNTRAWYADSDAEWDPEEQKDMEKQFEELYHGLRRDLRLRGVKGESLNASPHSTEMAALVDKVYEVLAGATGIPKRILMGSERGELSSEQDENNWAGRIAERRQQFATPKVVRPVIDRLISLGVLPNVKYDVEWPESDTLGEQARAEIAGNLTTALSNYANSPGAEFVVPVPEFRSRILGLDEYSEFGTPGLDDADGLPEQDADVVVQFERAKKRQAQ